jgi:hypothetical protein
MAESGKQNEPISGRRQGDASKCEMNRFGRVAPIAGRHVIDSRASFPSLLTRAVVWLLELHVSRTIRRADVFAFEPGPASRKHGPTPERCPRQESLGRNGPSAFTLCHRASGPFRAPFAIPSQWIQGREVEMTVQCHYRANRAAVCRCHIRTYDQKMRGPNGGIDG